MREKDIIFKTKACLTFMARGGLRKSLFEDSPWCDAEMMLEAGVVEGVPRSQLPVMVKAIEEWRADHLWLQYIPDKVEGDAQQ